MTANHSRSHRRARSSSRRLIHKKFDRRHDRSKLSRDELAPRPTAISVEIPSASRRPPSAPAKLVGRHDTVLASPSHKRSRRRSSKPRTPQARKPAYQTTVSETVPKLSNTASRSPSSSPPAAENSTQPLKRSLQEISSEDEDPIEDVPWEPGSAQPCKRRRYDGVLRARRPFTQVSGAPTPTLDEDYFASSSEDDDDSEASNPDKKSSSSQSSDEYNRLSDSVEDSEYDLLVNGTAGSANRGAVVEHHIEKKRSASRNNDGGCEIREGKHVGSTKSVEEGLDGAGYPAENKEEVGRTAKGADTSKNEPAKLEEPEQTNPTKQRTKSRYRVGDLKRLATGAQDCRLRVVANVRVDQLYAQFEIGRKRLQPSTPLAVVAWDKIIATSDAAILHKIYPDMTALEALQRFEGVHLTHVPTRTKDATLWNYRKSGRFPTSRENIIAWDPYRAEAKQILFFLRGHFSCVEDASHHPFEFLDVSTDGEYYVDLSKEVHDELRRMPALKKLFGSEKDKKRLPLPDAEWNGLLSNFDRKELVHGLPDAPDWDDVVTVLGAGLVGDARQDLHAKTGYVSSAGISCSREAAKIVQMSGVGRDPERLGRSGGQYVLVPKELQAYTRLVAPDLCTNPERITGDDEDKTAIKVDETRDDEIRDNKTKDDKTKDDETKDEENKAVTERSDIGDGFIEGYDYSFLDKLPPASRRPEGWRAFPRFYLYQQLSGIISSLDEEVLNQRPLTSITSSKWLNPPKQQCSRGQGGARKWAQRWLVPLAADMTARFLEEFSFDCSKFKYNFRLFLKFHHGGETHYRAREVVLENGDLNSQLHTVGMELWDSMDDFTAMPGAWPCTGLTLQARDLEVNIDYEDAETKTEDPDNQDAVDLVASKSGTPVATRQSAPIETTPKNSNVGLSSDRAKAASEPIGKTADTSNSAYDVLPLIVTPKKRPVLLCRDFDPKRGASQASSPPPEKRASKKTISLKKMCQYPAPRPGPIAWRAGTLKKMQLTPSLPRNPVPHSQATSIISTVSQACSQPAAPPSPRQRSLPLEFSKDTSTTSILDTQKVCPKTAPMPPWEQITALLCPACPFVVLAGPNQCRDIQAHWNTHLSSTTQRQGSTLSQPDKIVTTTTANTPTTSLVQAIPSKKPADKPGPTGGQSRHATIGGVAGSKGSGRRWSLGSTTLGSSNNRTPARRLQRSARSTPARGTRGARQRTITTFVRGSQGYS